MLYVYTRVHSDNLHPFTQTLAISSYVSAPGRGHLKRLSTQVYHEVVAGAGAVPLSGRKLNLLLSRLCPGDYLIVADLFVLDRQVDTLQQILAAIRDREATLLIASSYEMSQYPPQLLPALQAVLPKTPSPQL